MLDNRVIPSSQYKLNYVSIIVSSSSAEFGHRKYWSENFSNTGNGYSAFVDKSSFSVGPPSIELQIRADNLLPTTGSFRLNTVLECKEGIFQQQYKNLIPFSFPMKQVVASTWDLPSIVDIGDVPVGESSTVEIPGPDGASGALRTLNATQGSDFIKVNGCGGGSNCTSVVNDGERVPITASPGTDIVAGEYSKTIEATLHCD